MMKVGADWTASVMMGTHLSLRSSKIVSIANAFEGEEKNASSAFKS